MLLVWVALGVAIRRAGYAEVLDGREARALWLGLAGLTVWIAASSWLALTGVYLRPWALRLAPLLVGFLVPTLSIAILLRWSAAFRTAAQSLVLWLPLGWLIGIHGIRITALGTILKYADGELPGHFILPVGVPDFLIGLTAPPLAWLAARADPPPRHLLFAWNLTGALIFVYAGFALHFSMPGPLRLFEGGPTTEAIFRFPLVLVPTFLVPFFVGAHVATLWRLRRKAGPST
ncbi:MAG: hypothetical protein ACR2P8_01000 [Myxococcota bacterium]